ncbi:MAG: hypothetical protein R3F43_23805 [bacterium]
MQPLHHPRASSSCCAIGWSGCPADSPAVELRVRVLAAQAIVPERVHLDAGRFDPVALDGALNRLRGRFGANVVAVVPRAVDDHRPDAAGRWEPVIGAPSGRPRSTPPRPAAMRPAPRPPPARAAGGADRSRAGPWREASSAAAGDASGPERPLRPWPVVGRAGGPARTGAWRSLGQVLWISKEADEGFVLRGWWD